MGRKVIRFWAAMLALVLLGVLTVPGCVITLGKGGSPDETEAGPGGVGGAGGDEGVGGEGGAGGQGGTDEDPFQGADPVAVNREGLRASATAYLVQGAVEQAIEFQGLDPETIDEATARQLFDDALPGAIEQADAWVSTLDPSVFEASVHPNAPYCSGLGCPKNAYCDSEFYKKTVTCSLQACGPGGCSACPDWFGTLKHLVSTAWCTYVCWDGEMVLGSVALVVTRWVNFQICLLP